MNSLPRWLISITDMPEPCQSSISAAACASTSSGRTAGPALKLKTRVAGLLPIVQTFQVELNRLANERKDGNISALTPRLHAALLRRVKEGPANRLRQLYLYETARGVQIVFTALVDNPDVAVFGRVFVRQYAIDLVQFQRGRVAAVVYTHRKMLCERLTSFHARTPSCTPVLHQPLGNLRQARADIFRQRVAYFPPGIRVKRVRSGSLNTTKSRSSVQIS